MREDEEETEAKERSPRNRDYAADLAVPEGSQQHNILFLNI